MRKVKLVSAVLWRIVQLIVLGAAVLVCSAVILAVFILIGGVIGVKEMLKDAGRWLANMISGRVNRQARLAPPS